jgi:hypothetical protein
MIDALLHREHAPYREIGHRSVAYVLERAGGRRRECLASEGWEPGARDAL